jgi:putative flippase GtrA
MVGASPSNVPFPRRALGPMRRLSGSAEIAGQGLRFGLAGGVVAVIYLATTSVLAEVLGMEFELALAIGFVVAIVTHFTLQRRFVWAHAHGFAVPLHHQAMRYLAVAGTQYGLTVAATTLLPGPLHMATEIVYLCVAAALTATNFVIFRAQVFHPSKPEESQ